MAKFLMNSEYQTPHPENLERIHPLILKKVQNRHSNFIFGVIPGLFSVIICMSIHRGQIKM